MTSTTLTNTSTTAAADIAARINDAKTAGSTVLVNGREVHAQWTRARCADGHWANGSVSVEVRGRRPGACGTVWVKQGQSVTIEVQA